MDEEDSERPELTRDASSDPPNHTAYLGSEC